MWTRWHVRNPQRRIQVSEKPGLAMYCVAKDLSDFCRLALHKDLSDYFRLATPRFGRSALAVLIIVEACA